MSALMRLGVSNGFFPNKAPVLQVDAGNHEPESLLGVNVVVGPRRLLGNGQWISPGYGSGQEYAISPNNRTGMTLIRKRGLPSYVLGFIPIERRTGMGCLSGCEGTSPLRPKKKRFGLGLGWFGCGMFAMRCFR